MSDLWLYRSVAESEAALLFLAEIFEELLQRGLAEKLREQLLITLLKFIDKLVEEESYPAAVVRKCLDLVVRGLDGNETISCNSGYFKMYFKSRTIPEFNAMFATLPGKSCCRAVLTGKDSRCRTWFAGKAAHSSRLRRKIKLIGKDFAALQPGSKRPKLGGLESNLF